METPSAKLIAAFNRDKHSLQNWVLTFLVFIIWTSIYYDQLKEKLTIFIELAYC